MNKFLKLLLIALVAALLPGCGSEKTNGTPPPPVNPNDGTTGAQGETKFAAFDALWKIGKPMVATIGSSPIQNLVAVNPAAHANSGLESGSTITLASSASDATKLSTWTLGNNAVARFQGIGAAAGVAQATSLDSTTLSNKFVLAYDDVNGVISVKTSADYGIGSTGAANAGANTDASYGPNQAPRQFIFTITKSDGTATSQSGTGTLNFIAGPTGQINITVPFTFVIG